MHSTTKGVLCLLLALIATALGYLALGRGDPRDLIGSVAMALLALLLWLSVRPGAAESLQAEPARRRAIRSGLFAAMLACALAATTRWPAGLDDGRGSDAALVLLVAAWMTGRFLPHREPRAGTP